MPSTSGPSPKLAELQQWLRWILTEPGGVAAALSARAPTDGLPRQPEPAPRLLSAILDAPPLPAERRLSVYSDAYFLRLWDCLASDFAAVRRALGEEDFRALAAEYLASHPSASPNVGDLGEALPEFLARHSLARRHPFLPDLARLEWNALACLHADRLPPPDMTALAGVTPEAWAQARLMLDPTVRFLETQWSVDRLWRDRALPEDKGAKTLGKKERRRLLLFRDADWVQVRALAPLPWSTLQRLAQGPSLEEVCAELEAARQSAGELQAWFSDWLRAGIVKKILFP